MSATIHHIVTGELESTDTHVVMPPSGWLLLPYKRRTLL